MKDQELLSLYRQMLEIRIAEERIAELQPEQEMRCPIHLCIGQEAVPVGVCSELRREDIAVGTHRSHGHYLAKGGSLVALMAELYGKKSGCAGGIGGSMHLIDQSCNFLGAAPIVACTIPLAVGMALGSRMQGKNVVCAAFFGDGATEEGVFYESLNYAMIKKLPVVFVCENNLYSTHTSLADRRPQGRALWEIAKGFGAWSAHGDGNDVLAVRKLTHEAISRARAGDGPSFLEFHTYRWLEHCGPSPDHELGYRTKEEVDGWIEKCPVVAFEKYLQKHAGIDEKILTKVRSDVARDVDSAIAAARKDAYPEQNFTFQNIYAE